MPSDADSGTRSVVSEDPREGIVLDLSRSRAPNRTAGTDNDAGVWTTWGRSYSRTSDPWLHGFDPLAIRSWYVHHYWRR
eukprot:7386048-Pyramimonas_sp.AAC.1